MNSHIAQGGPDYVDCQELCSYLQIPAPRKEALVQLFNVKEVHFW
jgi:hypothetical protein